MTNRTSTSVDQHMEPDVHPKKKKKPDGVDHTTGDEVRKKKKRKHKSSRPAEETQDSQRPRVEIEERKHQRFEPEAPSK